MTSMSGSSFSSRPSIRTYFKNASGLDDTRYWMKNRKPSVQPCSVTVMRVPPVGCSS